MIDQTLLNLRKDLAAVKKETAAIMADEKNAKRKLDENIADIEKYTVAARNVLKAGQEEDVKTLIARKQKLEETRNTITKAR